MKITNCKVNHMTNPCGYQMGTPVFSYVVEEAEGKQQTEARIVVSEAKSGVTVADTGFLEDLDRLGQQVSCSLQPRTRYEWKVTVRTDAGEEAESDPQYFETGKMGEPWEGRWITCRKTSERHPIFQKSFSLEDSAGEEGRIGGEETGGEEGRIGGEGTGSEEKCIDGEGTGGEEGRVGGENSAREDFAEARLYLCGLGLYEARLNGHPVTEERLTPYCNDYSIWVQCQTYDVSELLEKENQLSVTLAPGWYMGRFGFTSKPGQEGYYGTEYKLIAELRVVQRDGTVRVIGTDDTWTVKRSNIIFSNIYDGEQVDDTLEELPEEQVEYCEGPTDVRDRMSIPVYAQEKLEPVELLRTPAGEWVFDLGQNMAGSFRLRVQEPAGTRIHVQVGEVLQGGNFYRDNLRSAKAEYLYISDGREHILEPRFTFYGYRYAKVEGASNLKISDFTGLAYYSDISRTGRLETGDAMFNRLLSNISWGQKGNFLDVPTDCPQRDERMGWTADTQVFVPTASYLTDSYAFYRKYLYDMRMEQSHNEGAVPHVIPSFGMRESCSVWGDAACIMPWSLYLFYGDKQILEESYGSMKDWVAYIGQVDGENHGWRDIFHFGDWLALDHPAGGKDQTAGGTEEGFIADVYYLNDARILEKTAKLLDRPEEAEQYRELGEKILRGLREEYFTPTGRCAVNTQTAYVLSLHYGLTENREKALCSLLTLLKHKKNKIQTGFVGTPLILQVLSAEKQDKLAYEILHNEEYPGWLYEITLGATTVWERWNSMEPDGSVSSTGMNSFNHYAYGSVGEWMWRTLAGISPVEECPGFRKALIRPVPDYKTSYVDAEYLSPAGTYRVKWKVLGADEVELQVEVPFDCEAVLELPYAKDVPKRQTLQAGRHGFLYHTEEPLKRILSTNVPIGELMEVPEAKGMLTQMIPNLEQLPGSMRGMTLRQVMARYGDNAEMASRFDRLDEMLGRL